MTEGPNFKLDTKEIIGIIAKEHQIKLREDDPVFAAITLNEIVLGKYVGAISARLEHHLALVSAANSLQTSEANRHAEMLVTQAAEYTTNQMRKAADEIFASKSKLLAAQIDVANEAASEAKSARNWTIFINAIALVLLTVFAVKKLTS
jgi:hypothetical protein